MGKRGRSLTNQLQHCVRESFAPGQSKHAAKGQQDDSRHDGRTYSYASRSAKLDLAKNFGNWMREEHPEIKRAVDIRSEHANQFLIQRAAEGCTQATLEAYSSNLRSISKEIANAFGRGRLDWDEINTPKAYNNAVRTVPMSLEDRDTLAASFDRGSNGGRAVTISRAAGLRSEEIADLLRRDIAPDGSTVYVREGKGGRSRTVPVLDEGARLELVRIRQNTPDGAKVVPIQSESINKVLRSHMAKLGMGEKYKDTTLHALRKTWAQERYDRYRADGKSIADTMAMVNRELGHSDSRVGLLERYVQNIH